MSSLHHNGDIVEYPSPPGAGGDTSESPLRLIDDKLRGRWRFAIILGAVLAAILAPLAYQVAPVTYTCTGSIHVVPKGMVLFRETEDTEPLARYDSVIQTHALWVQSPRVILEAIDDPQLAGSFETRDEAFSFLSGGLEARAEKNSELITVSFSSTSPDLSTKALNAVLGAYQAIHGGAADLQRSDRLSELRSQRDRLDADYRAAERDYRDYTKQQGLTADDVGQLITNTRNYVDELNREIENLMIMLPAAATNAVTDAKADDATLAAEAVGDDPATNAPAGSRVIPEPTRSDLLMIDPDITRLEQQLIATRATIEAHVRKFRDPNHPVRVEDREIEQTLLDELDERMQAARGQWVANGGRIRPEADGAFMRTEREQRLGRLRAVQVRQQAQLDKYYTMRATLSEFQQRVDDLTRDIRIVDDRIKALDVPPDLTFSGQIKIHEGMRPLLPSRDKRRQMMVAGVFGGFGLSLGFFFLWGMIDRRAFSVSQLDSPAHAYRLLGILPHLKMTSEFDDDRDAAAQCVHQIRNRLEAVRNRESSTVIAVCSAFAEDGKTNLTMLLGWSFAAAGHRTLLVDADFVGRSLSRRTGTLESAGLREVLSRKWLDDEVRPLSAGNLSVLAAGRLESFGPEQIRVDDFEMLATELRAQFDIILIDTGPFVGGVEVLPLCAAADGVVFVVRRGRSRNRLDSCIDELRITSTPCFGVVLNRAAPEDCARYVSGSSGASGKGRRAATPSTLPVAMGPVNGRQSSVVCTIETRSLRDLDSTPGADS